jgi:hypothetical protein
VELDGILGADLLLHQKVHNLVTVVSLKLKDSSVFGVVYNASIAAKELHEVPWDSNARSDKDQKKGMTNKGQRKFGPNTK